MTRMGSAIIFFAITILFSLPLSSFAQDNSGQNENEKAGSAYGVFQLFDSGVQINNFDIKSRSIGIDMENHFLEAKLYLFSGLAWGYKHEPSEMGTRGHFFNIRTFRIFEGPLGLNPKLGVGLEAGYPTTNYDRSRFYYSDGNIYRYEIVFLERNINIPKADTHLDGVAYPFADMSLVKSIGMFNLEAGLRFQRVRFRNEEYNFVIDGGGTVKEKTSIRSVFIRIGVRLP